MNLNEPLINELRIEAATTRKLLERLPQESFAWKPHEKSRTLGEIAAHIANLPGLFIVPLLGDEMDHEAYTAETHTVAQILATFDENVARASEVLSQLSDERMLSTWKYRYGERVVFELPRFVVIRSAALNHLIHHRGQLSLYFRLLNVPLPPIYGPTADEGAG